MVNNEVAFKVNSFSHAYYAAISIDDQKIAFPHQDLKSLEVAIDVKYDTNWVKKHKNSIGWINFNAQKIAVYNITNQFELLNHSRDKRAVIRPVCAIFLNQEQQLFGILCDSQENLQAKQLNIRSIPPCMKNDHQVISGLASRSPEGKEAISSRRLMISDLNFSSPDKVHE